MIVDILQILHKELTHSRHVGKTILYNGKPYVVFHVIDKFFLAISETDQQDPPVVYLIPKKIVREQKKQQRKNNEKSK